MPSTHKPRSGSLQFWPRRRAKSHKPRIRSWAKSKDPKPLAFIGYKAGMTHIIVKDNDPNSMTKDQSISVPVTIVECPPLKIAASHFYKKTIFGLKLISEHLVENLDKELKRRLNLPKKTSTKQLSPEKYDEIKILVYTQPKQTDIGKKKPDLMEIALGGTKEDQLNFIKENIGKEISIDQIFEETQLIDIHAITTGRGFQGPVKRFGIGLTSHKAEKARRNPGSLGPWKGQTHIMWKVAHAGQTGYFTRTEYNKKLIKISTNLEEINPKSGIAHYGKVKNTFILIKGSIPGPKKRLIVLTQPIRSKKKISQEKPIIEYINKK